MRGCFIWILLVIAILGGFATQCGADGKHLTIEGKNVYCEPYGLLNEKAHKNDKVIYEAAGSSIFFGIILSETIIAPIYFFGYDLYEPVKVENGYDVAPKVNNEAPVDSSGLDVQVQTFKNN